jgi:hypothetical protein
MDLFFRKVGKDQGATLTALLTQITEFAKGDAGNGQLAEERRLLQTASRTSRGCSAPWSASSGRTST